jgi:hypothetical protein
LPVELSLRYPAWQAVPERAAARESELFWNKKAKDILEGTGAKDVSSTGEASADYNKSVRSHRA